MKGHVFLTINQRGKTLLNQLVAIHRQDKDAPRHSPQRRILYDCRCRCTRHNASMFRNYGESASRNITKRKAFAITPALISVLLQSR